MKRVTTFAAGALMVLLAVASPAEAGMWDWIKELSGPGPSEGRGNLLGTMCFDPLRTAPWTQPCAFVDWRSFENESDNNFPNNVRIEAYDFGVTWKLHTSGAIEVGAGAGLMRFSSDDRINNSGAQVITTKLTLTAPRVVLAPIGLFLDKTDRDFLSNLARVLKLYARYNFISGKLDATDFGVRLGTGPGESTFSVDGDFVPSYGFIFDLGELLP